MLSFSPRGVDTSGQITDQKLYNQDMADFKAAIDYLKTNSPTARAEIEKLQNDPNTTYKIAAGNYDQTSWQNRSIQWAPRDAVKFGDKQSISPALALYHELAGHADITKAQMDEFAAKNQRWDAPTDKFGPRAEHERHATLDIENPVAKELNAASGKTPETGGEAIRNAAFYAKTKSPLSEMVRVDCTSCNIPPK